MWTVVIFLGVYFFAGGVIPDAKMIHEARKRRQMARELGDFVPVDDTVKVEKSSSRLIRWVVKTNNNM